MKKLILSLFMAGACVSSLKTADDPFAEAEKKQAGINITRKAYNGSADEKELATPNADFDINESYQVEHIFSGQDLDQFNLKQLGIKFLGPLTAAIINGHLETIKKLFELYPNIDVNALSPEKLTPLWLAVDSYKKGGQTAIIEYLLEKKADPNIKVPSKKFPTPIHVAAKNEYEDVVKLLIQHGADLTIRDDRGELPADKSSGQTESILKFGALKNLIQAAYAGDVDKVKAYLAMGADPNETLRPKSHEIKGLDTRLNAFQAALLAKKENVIELLLQNANIKPEEMKANPLDFAVRNSDFNIAKMLLAKMDINKTDDKGDTILDRFVQHGTPRAVRFLIEHGAKSGEKTQQLADARGDKDILAALHGEPAPVEPVKPEEEYEEIIVEEEEIVETREEIVDITPGDPLGELIKAASKNEITNIDKFLAQVSDPNEYQNPLDQNPLNPLSAAVLFGNNGTVLHLLTQKIKQINVNVADPATKRTALHYAVLAKKPDVAKTLIDHGADVNAQDNRKATPLIYTAEYNTPAITRLLLQNKADWAPKINIKLKNEPAPMRREAYTIARDLKHTDVANMIKAAKDGTLELKPDEPPVSSPKPKDDDLMKSLINLAEKMGELSKSLVAK